MLKVNLRLACLEHTLRVVLAINAAQMRAAYKALIGKFGSNAKAAADFIWDNRRTARTTTVQDAESFLKTSMRESSQRVLCRYLKQAQQAPGLPTRPYKTITHLQEVPAILGYDRIPMSAAASMYDRNLREMPEASQVTRELMFRRFLDKLEKSPQEVEEVPGAITDVRIPADMRGIDVQSLLQEFKAKSTQLKTADDIARFLYETLNKALIAKEYSAMYAASRTEESPLEKKEVSLDPELRKDIVQPGRIREALTYKMAYDRFRTASLANAVIVRYIETLK